MIKKLLEVYKIYFLISILVSCLVFLANYENTPIYIIIPAILMSSVIPFVYELDYIFYSYLIEPEAKFSQDIRSFINTKNYKGAFVYAHENESLIASSVLRSVITVIGIFAIAFLSIFTFSNVISQTALLTFLLTSIYLQTASFVNKSYRSWYHFIEFIPKENAAKVFLGLQYIIYIIFLLNIF